MKIVKTDANNRVEHIKNNRDFISSALDEIFVICREDGNFVKARSKVQGLDGEVAVLQQQVNKQNNLLEKSQSIKSDILTKLSILENENENVKNELLRKLGSTLWEY